MSLPLPPDYTDPAALADWIELRAILADDGSASVNDARQALVAGGEPTPPAEPFGAAATIEEEEEAADNGEPVPAPVATKDEDEPADPRKDEVLAADAFTELARRKIAAGEGYPFNLDNDLLQRRSATLAPADLPYVFCLILSWRATVTLDAEPKPERIFEELCAGTAGYFLPGYVYRFGHPRSHLPKAKRGFFAALGDLCERLREAEARAPLSKAERKKHKDGDLDIVVWRPFPDARSSQLILYGQCAAGRNWEGKLTEGAPQEFHQRFLTRTPAAMPVKAFFTPFRIAKDEDWRDLSYRTAGLLFDRCRIASTAAKLTPLPIDLEPWVRSQLKDLATATARPPSARRRRRRAAA